MSIEAAAQALAPEAISEAPVEIQEPSEDAALLEIYNRNNPDEAPEEAAPDVPPAAESAPDEAKAPAVPEPVDVPTDIPLALKKHWQGIPEEARSAFIDSQREMSRKLGENTRLVNGIAPIRDVLVEAVKDLPQLADMKPDQVAREVMVLARLNAQFRERPAETMLGMIKQHGMEAAVLQALSGQRIDGASENTALKSEIANLKRQLSQVADPQYLRSQMAQFTTESQAMSTVEDFASKAEHWQAVEAHMPAAIQFVQAKLGESASTKDVLSQAYELAVGQFVPQAAKAQSDAAPEAIVTTDPEKAQAALKAKSVNVSGKPSTPRKLTEDEELLQVYRRMQKQ